MGMGRGPNGAKKKGNWWKAAHAKSARGEKTQQEKNYEGPNQKIILGPKNSDPTTPRTPEKHREPGERNSSKKEREGGIKKGGDGKSQERFRRRQRA